MAEDYYDDSTDSGMSPKESKANPKTDDGSESALLPLTFFPEKPEPGKVCKVRVEKLYGDQASVTYLKDDEEEPEMEEEDEMPEEEDLMA